MLKLYKATIVASVVIGAFTLFIGILFEWCWFPHGTIIQNLTIGIACSLLVVIITTTLQYRFEHQRALANFHKALNDLCFKTFMAYTADDDELNSKQYQLLFDYLDDSFKQFRATYGELSWFLPIKNKKQRKLYMEFAHLELAFEEQRFTSHVEAVNALTHNVHFLKLLDASISFLPDGYGKDHLEWIRKQSKKEK